jgi:hypothetical protein
VTEKAIAHLIWILDRINTRLRELERVSETLADDDIWGYIDELRETLGTSNAASGAEPSSPEATK